MENMKVVRVFVDEKGSFGNPVGIIIDTNNSINKAKRQQLAIDSGFSEITFINDIESRDISIYSPTRKIPFAGHALVGTAYYLAHQFNLKFSELVSMGEVIHIVTDGQTTWIQGKLSILPHWNFEELPKVSDVENLTLGQTSDKEHVFVWSWKDRAKGVVRARTFAADWDIPEDEANGSGSMILANKLNRELTILHGKGSVIYSKPLDAFESAVGGRAKLL